MRVMPITTIIVRAMLSTYCTDLTSPAVYCPGEYGGVKYALFLNVKCRLYCKQPTSLRQGAVRLEDDVYVWWLI